MKTTRIATVLALALALAAAPVRAAAVAAEVRATFEKFVAAQNAHDPAAVGALLMDSESFLWITRGNAVWGRAQAVERFKSLYEGTWKLEPDMKGFKVVASNDTMAEIFVPVHFTIGPKGEPAQKTPFYMIQVLRKEAGGWKIASILPFSAGLPKPVPGK
jgi:ketosteroid isomerase-like protein